MEKAYKNIVLLFIIITLIVLIGFYNTYFTFFPEFEQFKTFHHIHGFVMVLWLFTLIAQPILITKKKYKWHRAIGKVSYILVPIIVITMIVAYRHSFITSVANNGVENSETLIMLFLPFTDILPFTIFYILAIFYRKDVATHMRYMISTAVLVMSAGLLRLIMVYLGLDFVGSFYVSIVVMALIFVFLIYYDFRNKKLSKNKTFLNALVIFSIPNLLLLVVPHTAWWLAIAESLAK
jgi:hypothetical protein